MSAVNLVLEGHLHPGSQLHCPLSSFRHTLQLTLHEQHCSGALLLCTACPTYPLILRSLQEAFPSPLDTNPKPFRATHPFAREYMDSVRSPCWLESLTTNEPSLD